jgi:hypothetical protein
MHGDVVGDPRRDAAPGGLWRCGENAWGDGLRQWRGSIHGGGWAPVDALLAAESGGKGNRAGG